MIDVVAYIKERIPEYQTMPDDQIENHVVDAVISTPYPRATPEQIHEIVRDDYYPGLFQMIERSRTPEFLLEENKVGFNDWILRKFDSEIEQFYEDPFLRERIENLGRNTLLQYCRSILDFRLSKNRSFMEIISNQEYSDYFRRIIVFLLTGNPFYIFHSHKSFNQMGREIAPKILSMTAEYTLRDRLFQSIATGMMGMDIKERRSSTAPISLNSSLDLVGSTITQLTERLAKDISSSEKIGIDCFEEYEREVIYGENLQIVWFTDDYIETIFEMKFIEEQMTVNKTLSFTLVPRFDSYANDASYCDVIDMLELEELSALKQYYQQGRFGVCRDGMDISTVDFLRMSAELYKIMRPADICVLSGARAYEMGQGLNKVAYYTGIAVCKSYTESITGFSRDSGKLIFLRQDAGEHSFESFRDRAWRTMEDNDNIIHVAGVTAKEYNWKKRNKTNTNPNPLKTVYGKREQYRVGRDAYDID